MRPRSTDRWSVDGQSPLPWCTSVGKFRDYENDPSKISSKSSLMEEWTPRQLTNGPFVASLVTLSLVSFCEVLQGSSSKDLGWSLESRTQTFRV